MDGRSHPEKAGAAALQLWTIREALAADADEALRRVKAAGFVAVEVAPPPPGLSWGRLAECLGRHGLAVVSIHGDLPTPRNIDTWTQVARELSCTTIIWHGWPRDPRFDSQAGVLALLAEYERAGAVARDHGLRFGLHNHWWEFEPAGGTPPIRLFHERLHPETFWQLDVYWAQVAGTAPAGAAVALAPRVRSIHWKDGPAVHGRPMTALGRGVVDIPGILGALTVPVDSIIELDECATDPLEAARESRLHLESLIDGAAEA